MNPLEIVGVAFGVAGVWLTVKQDPRCWPVGLVNVLLFAVVFWRARLYGAAGLQVVYAVLALYGWHAWLHGGAEHGRLRVSRVPRAVLGSLLGGGVVAALGLGGALGTYTDAALPMTDAATTAFSLVAQALQTRKWLENWVVWIVVDVAYVGMYVSQALYLTAGLYGAFLILAVLGLREWRHSLVVDATR